MKKIKFFLISLLAVPFIFSFSGCNKTPSIPETITINVASYNIKAYWPEHGDLNERFKNMGEQLVDNEIDIVGMQEVDNDLSRTDKINVAEKIMQYSNSYALTTSNIDNYYNSYTFQPAGAIFAPQQYGNAVISRYKMLKVEKFQLPWADAYGVVDGPDSGKVFIEKRCVIRTLLEIQGVEVAFYTAHLSYETVAMREKQFEFLDELLNNDTCQIKILTGDFNVDSYDEYKQLESDYGMVNNIETNLITFYSSKLKIDNIIYSKNITVNEYKVVESDFSDHYMLKANITIKCR